MTSWLAWGVLMLAGFCKAGIFSNELDVQINQGIEKINATEKLVGNKVKEVNREINKISLYFSRAVNESMVEGQKIYNSSVQKVDKIIITNFEEGIDKNKDINILLHILEIMETTKNELDGVYDIFGSDLRKVLAQKSKELEKLKNLFEFTEKYSKGFYERSRANVKKCKDNECIKQLVNAAETKTKILTNTFQKYVKEMSKISDGLRDGHRRCIPDTQKKFGEALKKFDNEIEYIYKTQGTEDLTDSFDSVILEW